MISYEPTCTPWRRHCVQISVSWILHACIMSVDNTDNIITLTMGSDCCPLPKMISGAPSSYSDVDIHSWAAGQGDEETLKFSSLKQTARVAC